MKSLLFDYYMQIDYSVPVSKCNYTIKCIPQNTSRQKIENIKINLFPSSDYSIGTDGLGNSQIYGSNAEHTSFSFQISGEALTGIEMYEEKENESASMIFKHPYGLNKAGENIKKYYEKIASEVRSDDAYETSLSIMNKLHKDFSYKQLVTTTETTAEEAFSLGQGVCQDYAHIFISLLHLAKIPARYVTGLIIGEGASHAWVEILHNGYWYGLDPTNNTSVTTDHIKIGVGRDAKDCMINRGIMHGGGFHTQKITVKVEEIKK
ncbi:MAG: transglutaminase family protein [Lachnospiraceae bacterium]|nr:transglutaminase family protein [Lachnospiraceae bacterium]